MLIATESIWVAYDLPDRQIILRVDVFKILEDIQSFGAKFRTFAKWYSGLKVELSILLNASQSPANVRQAGLISYAGD